MRLGNVMDEALERLKREERKDALIVKLRLDGPAFLTDEEIGLCIHALMELDL